MKRLLCSSCLYQSQVPLEWETGPWLLDNTSHRSATCRGTRSAWWLWANIRNTAVGASLQLRSASNKAKYLLYCIGEPNVKKGTRGKGWKLVKSMTHCHGRRCGFLCGVRHVVWRCEDASLDATRWRKHIFYWAYVSSTINAKTMKPAIQG